MFELLILRPSSLGDIVHSLGVVQSIKVQRPETRVTWVVRDTFAPLLESVRTVDRLINFDRHGGMMDFLRLLRVIRKWRFDAVLDMQSLFRTGLMNLAAKAPLKISRCDQTEGASLFAHQKVGYPKTSVHAVDILLEFLPPLGLKPVLAPVSLKPGVTCPPLPPRCTLVFPSSRGKWAEKEWPHFAQLTRQLLAEGMGPIAWATNEAVDVPEGALDFSSGKVKLNQLMAFIAQARLVVGNDSGPTHMATILGVPTVAMYGPTLVKETGLYPLESPRNASLKSPNSDIRELAYETVHAKVVEFWNQADLLRGI